MQLRMQYATAADGVRIAFGTAGSGPWIVRVPGPPFVHSQIEWEQGSDFFDRLAANWSVVQFDPRGCGLSDREPADLTLEARLLDIEAVVERLGLEQFVLHGIGWSGPAVITYAVRNPHKVTHLVLDDSQARIQDFMSIPQIRALDQLTGEWESFLDYLVFMTYGLSRAEAEPVKSFLRATVTQDGARRIFAALRDDDVTGLLPQVSQPTLVVQHAGLARQEIDNARQLAAMIPNARLLVLEGMATDNTDRIVAGIAELLGAEVAPFRMAVTSPPRQQGGVRAILFTDMVGHTEMMSRLGDEKGREVLREHERITRETLARFSGDEVKTLGDGFMASFGSVTLAVECAVALQKAFAGREQEGREPIRIRIGLNAGEPIEEGGDLFGATVIMASRIAMQAGAGEILASDVVRALCAGKGFLFADRGENVLRGFEDPVRLYQIGWRSA